MCWAGRERAAGTSALQEPALRLRRGLTLYTWPAARALGPGEEMDWPLWVHPRERGQFDFHLAVFFEPEAPVEGMNYRYAYLYLVAAILCYFCVWIPAACALYLCTIHRFSTVQAI